MSEVYKPLKQQITDNRVLEAGEKKLSQWIFKFLIKFFYSTKNSTGFWSRFQSTMDTIFVLVGQGGITVGAAFYEAVLRRCGKFDEHTSADGYVFERHKLNS